MMRTSDPRRKRELFLGFLCIALVIVAGLVQVAHCHVAGTVSHPECALCVTAHATASPFAPVTLPTVPKPAARIEIELALAGPLNLLSSCFRIRPPPVVPASI
jgi:hypothetical protein